jgi:uncharacterized BrkB/YihY/UPF0761 family membrane protein
MKSMTDKQTVSRDITRVVVVAALVLLVPLAAMQFTTEVAWGLLDFAVAGALLVGTGTVYVVLANRTVQKRRRVVIGLVLAAALVLLWAELAVGIFGTRFAGT